MNLTVMTTHSSCMALQISIKQRVACIDYIFLKYIQLEIASFRSIFDFIIVSDVSTDAEILWSLLNGFIFSMNRCIDTLTFGPRTSEPQQAEQHSYFRGR